MNIFDSILLILLFNNFIFNYLPKNKNKIINSENNNNYYLISILYTMYKYLWSLKDEKIKNKRDLKFQYTSFLNYYIEIKNQN